MRRLDYLRGLSSKERVRNVCDDHLRIMERPPPAGTDRPRGRKKSLGWGAHGMRNGRQQLIRTNES